MNLFTAYALLLAVALTYATAEKGSACAADFWSKQLEQMQRHRDTNVDPCSDYYTYACGNWRAPQQLHARDSLTAVQADNKRQLMEYFEQVALRDELEQLEPRQRAVVQFYNSCVDDSLKTEQMSGKLQAYTDVLRRYSDWPLLNPHFQESTANASFNWEHVSAQLRRYGVQAPWRVLLQSNWQAAEQQIFYVAPPSFDLLKAQAQLATTDEDTIFLYKRYVKYLLLALGVRVRRALNIADEVVEFERSLHALTQHERSVELKEPHTLASLALQFPEIKLREYFATLLQDLALPAGYEQQLLIVADEAYLRKLAQLLARSKAETIGQYLLVQFLAHFEVQLHEDESLRQRKEFCLRQLHTFLPSELSALFLQLQQGDGDGVAYLQRTQTELQRVFEQLKQQFEQLLNATNVFERDAVTKVLGLEKLRAMRLLLPQLPSASSGSNATLQIGENYDLNLLQLSREQAQRQLSQILPSLSASSTLGSSAPVVVHTPYSPLDINAYYRLKKNAIELPVGLLRAPLYDACQRPAKVYGGFVYMLAHELLHGFDYDGLNYDKSGNVASSWGPKAIIKFGSKSSCYLSERYSAATITINENIADAEGLRLALAAFVQSEPAAAAQPEQLQLFFLSFAQTWCGTGAESGSLLHADHAERVNNVLGNFAEFAETFKCKTDSPMNPEEKCRIW